MINNIANFVLSPFRIEEYTIFAAKAAYLTQIIKQDSFDPVFRYKSAEDVADLTIKDREFTKFNGLKRTFPEAFYYWYWAIELI